jgi:hypothetical protein
MQNHNTPRTTKHTKSSSKKGPQMDPFGSPKGPLGEPRTPLTAPERPPGARMAPDLLRSTKMNPNWVQNGPPKGLKPTSVEAPRRISRGQATAANIQSQGGSAECAERLSNSNRNQILLPSQPASPASPASQTSQTSQPSQPAHQPTRFLATRLPGCLVHGGGSCFLSCKTVKNKGSRAQSCPASVSRLLACFFLALSCRRRAHFCQKVSYSRRKLRGHGSTWVPGGPYCAVSHRDFHKR